MHPHSYIITSLHTCLFFPLVHEPNTSNDICFFASIERETICMKYVKVTVHRKSIHCIRVVRRMGMATWCIVGSVYIYGWVVENVAYMRTVTIGYSTVHTFYKTTRIISEHTLPRIRSASETTTRIFVVFFALVSVFDLNHMDRLKCVYEFFLFIV